MAPLRGRSLRIGGASRSERRVPPRRSVSLTSLVPRWLLVTASVIALVSGVIEAGVLAIVVGVAGVLSGSGEIERLGLGPLELHATAGVLVVVGLVLIAVRLVLSLMVVAITAHSAAAAQTRLRRDLVDAFLRSSWMGQIEEREGALQELIIGHTQRLGMSVSFLLSGLAALANLVALTAAAFVVAPIAAALTAIIGTVITILLRPLVRRARRRVIELADAELNFAGLVHETSRVVQELGVFGVQDAQAECLSGSADKIRRNLSGQRRLSGFISSIYQTVALAFILAGLGLLYAFGTGNVASLGAAVLMLVRSLSYAQTAHHSRQGVRDLTPYYGGIVDACERLNRRRPTIGLKPLRRVERMELVGVSFGYAGRPPVLRDVNCSVAANEAVAIVGPSGEGKTTLAMLLLRLIALDSGEYLVNGAPADEYSMTDWTRRISYVSQFPQLLTATVRENIRFFRDLTDVQIEEAAQAAGILDEILAMPQGFDTVVGNRRDSLSGGQQQRVALARALVGSPDVLILDEPTSALDPASEAAVHDSLASLRGSVTMVIVAHKAGSVELCDRVLAVEAGTVRELDRSVLVAGEARRLLGGPER